MLIGQGWGMPFRNQGRVRSAPLFHTGWGDWGAEGWEETHKGISEEKEMLARHTKIKVGYLPQ